MAINFLNTVNFNRNQLEQVVIQSVSSDPTTNNVVGQIIFNTTDDTLKQYVADTQNPPVPATPTPGWVEVGSTSAVETFTNTSGTYVAFGTNNAAAKGNVTVGTVDLTAVNGGAVTDTRFLSKDNTWDKISFNVKDAEGTPNTFKIGPNDDLIFSGVAYSAGGGTITDASTDGTVSIGLITTAGTPSATTFYRGDGSWVVPTNDLYTLGKAAASNDLILKNDGTDQDTIVFNGTAKEIKLDVATADSYTFSLADGAFAAWGSTGTNLQLPEHATAKTPASGDDSTRIATTAFVQAAVTGLLEFKGGFDADTGTIVGGTTNLTKNDQPNTGDQRVAVAVGDYYVVTVAGDFFGNTATPLTPGDSVIVQTTAAAGASTEADFIIVQSDTDLATLSTVGLGNVNADTDDSKLGISVSYLSGTAKTGVDLVGLDAGGAVDNSDVIFGNNGTKNVKFAISDIVGKSSVQLLLDTPNVTGVTNQSSPPTGTQGWVINSNTVLESAALGCSVEVMTAAGQTVYADVSRSGNAITINFTAPSAITQGTYRAIVTRG
tara:strand:- start:21 stop:1664 length:1644 start_codon:yes stop_codon:yes gene_type:complete